MFTLWSWWDKFRLITTCFSTAVKVEENWLVQFHRPIINYILDKIQMSKFWSRLMCHACSIVTIKCWLIKLLFKYLPHLLALHFSFFFFFLSWRKSPNFFGFTFKRCRSVSFLLRLVFFFNPGFPIGYLTVCIDVYNVIYK